MRVYGCDFFGFRRIWSRWTLIIRVIVVRIVESDVVADIADTYAYFDRLLDYALYSDN